MENGPSSVPSLCRGSRIGVPPAGDPSEPRERKEASYVLKLKQASVDKTRLPSAHFLNILLGNHKHHASDTHTHLDTQPHASRVRNWHAATHRHTITHRELFRPTPSEMQLHSCCVSHTVPTHTNTCTHTCHIHARHPTHNPTTLFFRHTTPHTPSQPYTTSFVNENPYRQ